MEPYDVNVHVVMAIWSTDLMCCDMLIHRCNNEWIHGLVPVISIVAAIMMMMVVVVVMRSAVMGSGVVVRCVGIKDHRIL